MSCRASAAPDPAPWAPTPEALTLAEGVVHAFRARLEQTPERAAALSETLAQDERERAARFHFRRDREHFVVARGFLRLVLGRFLKLDPSTIKFTNGPFGKPRLAAEMCRDAVRFNLSHSNGVALLAVTSGREVGIDLEWMRPDIEDGQLAARFFSPAEVAALKALPAGERVRGFFNCWTRKEAYVKATGAGLSAPLKAFDVSVAEGDASAQLLLSVEGSRQKAARWAVCGLDVGEGFVGALAVEGSGWQLRRWQL